MLVSLTFSSTCCSNCSLTAVRLVPLRLAGCFEQPRPRCFEELLLGPAVNVGELVAWGDVMEMSDGVEPLLPFAIGVLGANNSLRLGPNISVIDASLFDRSGSVGFCLTLRCFFLIFFDNLFFPRVFDKPSLNARPPVLVSRPSSLWLADRFPVTWVWDWTRCKGLSPTVPNWVIRVCDIVQARSQIITHAMFLPHGITWVTQ